MKRGGAVLKRSHKSVVVISALVFGFLSGACGTMNNEKKWGEDATFFAGWSRIRAAR